MEEEMYRMQDNSAGIYMNANCKTCLKQNYDLLNREYKQSANNVKFNYLEFSF